VIPLLNRYTNQLDQNDFSGVSQDRELNTSLQLLQGASVYFREGTQYSIDRESDLINLYAAVDWLRRLKSVVDDPRANDPISQSIRSGWRENRLTVNFKGFMLQDYRIPHRDRGAQPPSQEGQSQPYNRFRIVNPLNLTAYPDFEACRIPESVVYSWTVRPSSNP
jgi:hypothetical protein